MIAAEEYPADRPRAQAASSVALGRSCGLGPRQRATTSRNAGEKSAGSSMASLGSLDPEGVRPVRASNKLTPSAQMSPAVELLACRPSGGSYTVGVVLSESSLTLRIVSLASFN